jgi:hypothetical protein
MRFWYPKFGEWWGIPGEPGWGDDARYDVAGLPSLPSMAPRSRFWISVRERHESDLHPSRQWSCGCVQL